MEFEMVSLQHLVNIAGAALECRDRFMLGCTLQNPHLYEHPSGVLLFDREWYNEAVIFESLLSSFPFRVRTQVNVGSHPFDLALYATSKERSPEAYGEIEGWWSEEGEGEIDEISKNIGLLRQAPSNSAFLIILTNSPPKQAQENIVWLQQRLKMPTGSATQPYTFLTQHPSCSVPDHGYTTEFAIFGVLVK